MKRLVVSLAAIMLLSILAAGIAAAATTPGTTDASVGVGGTQSATVVASGKDSVTVESVSTFGQHGFCDQDDYASPASY